MADTKISDLPAVTTPASTDEFAVNQGGVSKKQTREQLHTLESGEHLVLPQVNEPATPALAFGDGNSGFYEAADNEIRITISLSGRWGWAGNDMSGLTSGAPILRNIASSATVPTVAPSKNDPNTGMGLQAADNLSLIAGGLEGVRVEDPADLAATETSLWLYDKDADTITQVKVGANGSGSIANHRMLQVADS